MAKVLLVEDDNNLREIYEARLQAEGYDIVSAMNGEEALVVAKKERPDLIISDVMMPRISGFEMLDILRNTEGLRDVHIIMLTALGQAEDKTRADQLGADRYLVKSQVTLEDIVTAVHELLNPAEAQPAAVSPETAAPPAPSAPAEQPAAPEPSVAVTPAPAESPAPADPITPAAPVAQPAPDTIESAGQGITVVPPPEPAAAPMPALSPPTPVVDPIAAAPAPTPLPPAPEPPVSTPVVQPPVDNTIPAAITPEQATPPAPNLTPEAAASTATVAQAQPQSASAEEQAVNEQIQSFVNTPVAPTTIPGHAGPVMPGSAMPPAPVAVTSQFATTPQQSPAPTPAEQSAVAMPTAPATTSPPTVNPLPADPSGSPSLVMADAIKDLVDSTQQQPAAPAEPRIITPPSEATQPAYAATNTTPDSTSLTAIPTASPTDPTVPVATPADSAGATHKKVISPISSPESVQPPDLNQLLAKEGITDLNDMPTPPAMPPQPTAIPQPPVAPPTAPANPIAPAPAMPIAPPQAPPAMPDTEPAPHPPGQVISPNTDPNRIAL